MRTRTAAAAGEAPRASAARVRAGSGARRVARAALAAAAGALLAGLSLEAALRAAGAPPAVASPLHGFHRSDPELGWVGAPSLRRRLVRPAFDVLVEHDAAGFRRPQPPPPAAARERVLVLGDSLTWGWGVGQGELFTDWLQRALAPQVAVVNRGVNAYATSQELLLLARELERGPWSRVLLFFTPGDLEENLDGKGGRRPLFALQGGRLVPRNQPAAPLMGRWPRFWKEHSRAFLWLELLGNRALFRLDLLGNRAREWLERGPPRAARRPVEPPTLPGRLVTARLLAEMGDRARAAGAAFHVVYVPADAELGALPSPAGERKAGSEAPARPEARGERRPAGLESAAPAPSRVGRANSVRDPLVEAARAMLRDLARAEGLPLVDLTRPLSERARGRGLRFATDDHLDARGHRLVAEALLDSPLFSGACARAQRK
jgi:hypothetical protein